MAKKEIYRLDIKIGVNGDSEAKKKLTATERFAKQSERKMKALDKIKASPTVRLNDKLSKPLKKVEGKLSSFSKRACSKLAAVATAATLAVGGIGIGSSIKTFTNFEQGMKNVQATSQATNAEFKQLWNTAKDLGAKTSFSAKEASDGMNYLAMAGFKTNEIIEAMPGLLDLAAAAGSDLGVTSDIVSDAITAFGLKTKDTAHLADIMAKASSTANTNVEMLGEAYKYAAAPAHAFGMSAEETTAALAMMANAGIKSSMAGTALRGALTRLSKPPKEAAEWLDRLGVSISDNHGKIRPFNAIMGDMRNKISKLTQAEKQQAIASIFGQEAMSGMLAVLNTSTKDFENYTQSLKNADGTAKEMAKTKLDSLGGQFTILKSAVEGMNIELGERLAPYAKEFVTWFTGKIPDITNKIVEIVDKVSDLAHKFNALSPATKKFIGYLVLGVVTVGPIVKGINGIASAVNIMVGLGSKVGSFFGLFKGVSTVAKTTTAVAKSTGLASKGIGLFGLSAKASTLLLNPWTWGIGAATVAGVKLYKHLKKDSIPEVQRFGSEISQSTQKSVGAFMDLEEKATKSLNKLKWSGTKVTTELKDDLSSNFNEMTSQITTKLDERNQKSKDSLQKMFANSKTLSDKEKQVLISNTEKAFNGKKQKIIEGNAKIQEILNNAASNNRKISEKEYDDILKIKAEMMTSAVEIMSESEAEQGAILERMKLNASTITAQQASDIVQKSLEQKEKTIASAQEEYNERLRFAAMLRAQGGEENEKLADKVVTEAQRQLDESTTKAEAMHTQVVEHARQQAGEHAAQVEWETGKVKSNFDIMMDKIREFNALPIKEKVITITKKINSIFKKQNDSAMGTYRGPGAITGKGYASGTNYATSGVHEVAEHGFEIVVGRQHRFFNGGEKVINHRESKKVFNSESTKESKPKFMVAQPQLAGSGGNNIKVNVDMKNNFNNDDDVETIVQEAMHEFGYKLKEALKNTK
ncbi:phage tail tape measure protein [Clostridium cochlearium]|uniref:phage tail tape measure protein n=1 Tax=Clostridium cochlearium TaxID=1494 RepID=UPI001459E0D2|nr:phage tail tape measure protein [Clostridium cochlearium]NME95364.1 phage tail tape measure protein [Clostridium cochlearium]